MPEYFSLISRATLQSHPTGADLVFAPVLEVLNLQVDLLQCDMSHEKFPTYFDLVLKVPDQNALKH